MKGLYVGVVLVMSTLLAANAVDGIRTGKVTVFLRQVARREDAGRFWFAVGLSALVAAAALATLRAPEGQIETTWFPLAGALFFLREALNGIVNGTVAGKVSTLKRGEDGVRFWVALSMCALCGTGCLVFLIVGLL